MKQTPPRKRTRKSTDKLMSSSWQNTKPKVGMRLEISCQDNLFSSAKIVKVSVVKNSKKSLSSSQQHLVTIRYDGWGSEWDETVSFEDNSRLAKFGTYTKRFKCLVDILPKKGKNTSTLWPCIVNMRSPSPLVSLEDYELAEQFLREERKVFVQPYGKEENYFPNYLLSHDGGIWMNVSRIRMWRNNKTSFQGKTKPDNFDLAYDLAQQDDFTHDILPFNVFEEGSLIRARYRVTHPEDDTDSSDTEESNESSSVSSSGSSSNISHAQITDRNFDSQLIYHAPSQLPPALKVNTSIYPDSQIEKSNITGKWIAKYTKNGNEIILGSFTTQSEAQSAIKAATDPSGNEILPPSNDISAKFQDIKALTLGTVIGIGSQQEQHSFSLHEWIVQHAKHKGYELEKFRARFEELKNERESRSMEKRRKL